MANKERMIELINILNEATKAYDEGHPIMTDEEWDKLYFELVQLEEFNGNPLPNSPTQKIVFEIKNDLKKVKHNHLMLSLNKTKDINEIKEFVEKNQKCIIMEKLDGLTCSLRYVDGKLVSAETRGNGEIGEDILHNIVLLENVPRAISFKEELIIDGEVICDLYTFEKYFSDKYKNPRNYAAGAIRRLNSKENENCGLKFIAWDVIKGFDNCKTLSDKLIYLQTHYNFDIVNYLPTSKNIEKDIEKIKDFAVKDYHPIDGVVFKYNDIEYYQSLGNTEHHFRGGLAFKFYDEEYETRLKYIDWTMGRTGVLTPVAVFDPIDIDGTIVERASLHNYSMMKSIMGNCCYCGQQIKVFKANMIIPQISWARKMDYGTVISHGGITCDGFSGDYGLLCPICGGNTSIEKSDSGVENVVCNNPQCSGKLINRIDHFVGKKGLDIKGLSKATIEKLINWNWVSCLSDIFTLHLHRQEWINKEGFGEKSVDNILNAIEEGKKCSLPFFISSLGISYIGPKVAKEICKYYFTWEDFRKACGGKWSDLEGFGPEMEKALNNFDYTEADKIAKILSFQPIEDAKKIETVKGIIFCITGKLSKPRALIQADIEAAGGKVGASITGKTNYLICNKPETSAKYKAAVEKGLPIITEKQIYKMLQVEKSEKF